MKRDIPVFIHHETRSEYARKAIIMARKYNNHVVFFGDDTNKDYSDCWVDTNAYCRDEWERFKAVFKNMSYYDDGYAIKIFKRFFAMKEYMKEHSIDECILIDSDVLSFADYSVLLVFEDCDATLFIPREEEKGSDPMSYGNYFWGASAGTSYFNYKAIEEIIAFMLDMYENHIDVLETKWKWHQENNHGGGVCEMSLLFLWYLQTDLKVINTKKIFENDNEPYVIDNDVRTVNDRCKFIKYKRKNIEKLCIRNSLPYLIRENGDTVRAVCLHFGGNTKIYMYAYMNLKNAFLHGVLLDLAYIRLTCFNFVAKIYVKFFKKYLGKYRKPKHGNAY